MQTSLRRRYLDRLFPSKTGSDHLIFFRHKKVADRIEVAEIYGGERLDIHKPIESRVGRSENSDVKVRRWP